MRLFAYGTLMVPAVIEAVIGRRPEGAAAVLSGFARYRILGEEFPGLVPCDGAMTDGIVYDGLDRHEIALTDRFEGTWYERVTAKVSRAGMRVDTFVYVVRPEYRDILSSDPWDLEKYARQFRKTPRAATLSRRLAVAKEAEG
jgi:gamma-glutamylcyclotransferase (GGCT)/AIG2-like uncharacterized protein YtfP